VTPVYADDRATLYQGEALAVLRDLPTDSVDAVITDPPYSSGGMMRGDRMGGTNAKYAMLARRGKDRPEFSGDNRDQRSYGYWCALWLSECLRVTKPGGTVAMFSDWRQLPTTTDAIQAGGWVWRGIAVWDKTARCRPHIGRFTAQSEFIAWGSSGPMDSAANPYVIPGVQSIVAPHDDKYHVTGKPTQVMRWVVTICPSGGTILDPFAGSGTTGVAALIEGRKFIGVELSEHYAQVAADRLAKTAMKPAADQLDLLAPAGIVA
jgi:site-specific DNA-methyltransferase (adenine-specific)